MTEANDQNESLEYADADQPTAAHMGGEHFAPVETSAPSTELDAMGEDAAGPRASKPSHMAPMPEDVDTHDSTDSERGIASGDTPAEAGAPQDTGTLPVEDPEPYEQSRTTPVTVVGGSRDARPATPTPHDDDPEPEGPTGAIPSDDPDSTGPIPLSQIPQTADPHPPAVDLDAREDTELQTGSGERLAWAARTDVGLIRSHNEDSYLARRTLFGVCDGMGGHAAGEVASAIAVRAIAQHAPEHADDALLGAAVEAANEAVIEGAETGVGKPGMGCTASCCIIEGTHMAVAHAGDSRIYLLHAGTLVRVTHDHSYVEELVDAGEITADEARVHPSRSIITRALGSDPDMYADHFMLDVERGDRIIVCSDGLSSMIPDGSIEALSVSSATPQECVDNLVAAALAEGGHDNVTVICIDVVSDGTEEARRKARIRAIAGWAGGVAALFAVIGVALALIINNSWYVGSYAGNVGIYHGVHASVFGIQFSGLEKASTVSLKDLPDATQHQLAAGISVSSFQDAQKTVKAYEDQVAENRAKAENVAASAQSESNGGSVGDATGAAGPETAGQAPATNQTTTETAVAPETTAQTQGGE